MTANDKWRTIVVFGTILCLKCNASEQLMMVQRKSADLFAQLSNFTLYFWGSLFICLLLGSNRCILTKQNTNETLMKHLRTRCYVHNFAAFFDDICYLLCYLVSICYVDKCVKAFFIADISYLSPTPPSKLHKVYFFLKEKKILCWHWSVDDINFLMALISWWHWFVDDTDQFMTLISWWHW